MSALAVAIRGKADTPFFENFITSKAISVDRAVHRAEACKLYGMADSVVSLSVLVSQHHERGPSQGDRHGGRRLGEPQGQFLKTI